jgi:hypothetical protein
MTNKITKGISGGMFSIVSILTIAVATALSICAQAPPPIPKLPSRATVELTGVVRIPKEFGIVPAGPGVNQPNALPCAPYWVAVLDPDNKNKVVAVTESLLEPGRDKDNFYTCKYSLQVRANNRFYAIAGMGGPSQAPQGSRWPMYITDAWIGGTNNKPPRGYERGFAGKFITLGTRAAYLHLDMYYAQVDPN